MNTRNIFLILQPLLVFNFCFGSNVISAAELEKEFINSTPGFSQVATVTSNGITTIYISGQVGIRNGEVPASFSEQVDVLFANMADQLAAAGADFADVIKLTGFIVDIDSDRVSAYSQGRTKYFPTDTPPPASTLIGVSGLVFPALQIEVEAIAVIEE